MTLRSSPFTASARIRLTSSVFGALFEQCGVGLWSAHSSAPWERIAGDQIIPLGQRRRENRLVEIEVLAAKAL